MSRKNNKRNYFRIAIELCGAAALLLPANGLTGRVASAATPAMQQAASQDASSPAAKPSLAGTWKLNKDQSDDPREKMRQAMGSAPGSEAGGNPNRGEGRPGRGGGGMMAEWSQLTVTQLDANVKITGASGRTLANTAPADESAKSDDNANGGSSNSENASGNANGERRRMGPPAPAQWQGNQLVVNGRGFGGGSTTRAFELSPDGKQLYVTTKITSERFSQPVTYRLVYDKGSTNSSQ